MVVTSLSFLFSYIHRDGYNWMINTFTSLSKTWTEEVGNPETPVGVAPKRPLRILLSQVKVPWIRQTGKMQNYFIITALL